MLKLRVILITYNHEKFIAQALDSVLLQKVNFAYDILVLEDCSTDSTREILSDYQQKHPNLIQLVFSEENKNNNSEYTKATQNAPSQYVALLDGDDFWTSPFKLQRQVDYLDVHPECSMCFHNVQAFYEDERREPYNFNRPDQKEISTLEDILLENFIAGSSPILRASACAKLPHWLNNLQWGDWGLFTCVAHNGKIGYINEIMGAYRIHRKGFYQKMTWIDQLQGCIEFYRVLEANLDGKYRKTVKAMLSKQYYDLSLEYEIQKDLEKAKSCLRTCLTKCPFNKFVPLKDLWRIWRRLNLAAGNSRGKR